MKAVITYLGSDEFLPGLFVLDYSLKMHDVGVPLVVIVSEIVSETVISILKEKHIEFRLVSEIINPHRLENDWRNFKLTYTKLNIFALTEFEKIVYMDSDMLVCESIGTLFEKPHMSAVIAGSFVKENRAWVELNSGLLVIEPSKVIFNEILNSVNCLASKDGSDQGFLHSFFPDWRYKPHLHLDHKFNLPCSYLDVYCQDPESLFNYCGGKLVTRNVSILHFWSIPKPWHTKRRKLTKNSNKHQQALQLWWDLFDKSGFPTNCSIH